MNNLVHYIFESTLILSVLVVIYELLLKNTKSLRYNRLFLLSSPFLAFTLPLLDLPFFPEVRGNEILGFVYELPAMVTEVTTFIEPTDTYFQLPGWVIFIYSTGVVFFIFRLHIQISEIRFIIRNANRIIQAGRYKLVVANRPLPTFAYLNYIIIGSDKQLHDASVKYALDHEKVHIRQHHSWDVLFFEIIIIIMWFNPLIYYYKKLIRENHEFLADHYASGKEGMDYSLALLKELRNGLNNSIPSYFSLELTKRRLKMLSVKNNLITTIKPVFSFPLIALVFVAFSCKNELFESPALKTDQIDSGFFQSAPNDFNGIMAALSEKYPERNMFFRVVQDIELELVRAIESNYRIEYYSKFDGNDSENEYRAIKRNNKYTMGTGNSDVGMIISFPKKTSLASNEYFDFDDKKYQPEEVSEVPYPYFGQSHMARIIEKNTIYPDYSGAPIFEGTVWVKFTISPMGAVINAHIYKSSQHIDDQVYAELIHGRAIYAINSTYQYWHPGILNGNRVNVEMILPVEFKIK